MTGIVDLIDVIDQAGEFFYSRCSVRMLGEAVVRELFDISLWDWNQLAAHPICHSLNLFAEDVVLWRNAENPERRTRPAVV
ncbi:hypothetical protein FIP36_17350 [Salmonella enterica]|nr:hypothetical protein [Salmonella enterica]